MLLSTKYLITILTRSWDSYLAAYTTKDSSIEGKYQFSYLLRISYPQFSYNYFCLAKTMNFICRDLKFKYIIRYLAKNEYYNFKLVHFLSNKILETSFFMRWIVRLLIDEFYEYVKRYTLYICKLSYIYDDQKIKLKYFGSYYFFECPDLLILKFYKSRTKIWYSNLFSLKTKYKHQIYHNCININGESNGMSYLDYNIHLIRNKNLYKDRFVWYKFCFNKFQKLSILCNKRYINNLKNNMNIHKNGIQSKLIKKTNRIIKSWNRSWNILFTTNEYHNINISLYTYLWNWASDRHAGKSSTWIRKRYWHQNNKTARSSSS